MNRKRLNSFREGFDAGFKGDFAIITNKQRSYNKGYKKGMKLRFKRLRSN